MSAHLKAQALRFVRLTALAFAASLLMTGGNVGWSSLWSLLVGAGETALRELIPVESKPTVTAVPAGAPPATGTTPPSKG